MVTEIGNMSTNAPGVKTSLRLTRSQRSFVSGRVDDVKTEYSQDYVPLHPSLTEIVLEWSKEAVPTEEGWVFANPATERPYHPTEIQKRHLRPSGCCVVACPSAFSSGRLVPARSSDSEWRKAANPRRAQGRCREARDYRLAHIPPHVPLVVGRDPSSDEGATGTDASCLDPNDDECLWASHVVIEERSEWEGCGDGAQADESERLNHDFSFWEFLGVCGATSRS
ncbi:MAG: hypothetical protein WB762_31285 [Candidatus Sulfotelmatobacter sp.]